MKFTLLTGMLIFATTLMLMTLENIAAQRETRNLLAESSIARLNASADRLSTAVATNDVEFVQRHLTDWLTSLELSEIYVLNNRRELLGSAYSVG